MIRYNIHVRFNDTHLTTVEWCYIVDIKQLPSIFTQRGILSGKHIVARGDRVDFEVVDNNGELVYEDVIVFEKDISIAKSLRTKISNTKMFQLRFINYSTRQDWVYDLVVRIKHCPPIMQQLHSQIHSHAAQYLDRQQNDLCKLKLKIHFIYQLQGIIMEWNPLLQLQQTTTTYILPLVNVVNNDELQRIVIERMPIDNNDADLFVASDVFNNRTTVSAHNLFEVNTNGETLTIHAHNSFELQRVLREMEEKKEQLILDKRRVEKMLQLL